MAIKEMIKGLQGEINKMEMVVYVSLKAVNSAIDILERIDKKKIAALIADKLTTDDDGMYVMGSVGKDFLAGEIVEYLGGEK